MPSRGGEIRNRWPQRVATAQMPGPRVMGVGSSVIGSLIHRGAVWVDTSDDDRGCDQEIIWVECPGRGNARAKVEQPAALTILWVRRPGCHQGLSHREATHTGMGGTRGNQSLWVVWTRGDLGFHSKCCVKPRRVYTEI